MVLKDKPLDMDKVSIIVPVYNVESYLVKCIESILGQTYKNFEVIIVDDGSRDNSGLLGDQLSREDDRIHVIHKKNGGLSSARNEGLKNARGKWIMFVDSDDYLSIDCLNSLVFAAKDTESQISVCNMVRVFENAPDQPFYAPVNSQTVLDGIKRFRTLEQPSVCNKLFKADLLENIEFPEGKFYEDTYIYHQLCYKANKIVLTGKNGYYYLYRNNSIVGCPTLTDRYFDFIEAVYERAIFLTIREVEPFGTDACLSYYAALSRCLKEVRKTKKNKSKFYLATKRYKNIYSLLIKTETLSKKQYIRIFILRYFPYIHKFIY